MVCDHHPKQSTGDEKMLFQTGWWSLVQLKSEVILRCPLASESERPPATTSAIEENMSMVIKMAVLVGRF